MRDAREVALDVVLAAVPKATSAHEWHAREATTVIESDRRAAKLEVLAELEQRHTEECFRDPPMESESMLWVKAIDALRSEIEKATPSGEPSSASRRAE